jgi:2-oxo-3-hexenedioate decarboxylase
MSNIDINGLAQELLSSYTTGATIAIPPSARHPDFDLNSAYAVEAEFSRLRKESGRQTVGLKLGYANKAMWRKLGLDTLVWAHMYDDTVYPAGKGIAELRLPYYRSPRIEPEIVFGLKEPLASGGLDAAGVLRSVDWLAIGFEVIDCPYPEWRFKPADFVAAFGLHMALVVGPRLQVHSKMIPALVNDLGSFKVRISKDGQFIEDGFGKNALRSPALCLAELARAVARQSRTSPLVEGELVSTGTLTSGHPITPGETWQVDVDGLPLSSLRLRVM